MAKCELNMAEPKVQSVLIVESVSPSDMIVGRNEGEGLKQVLSLLAVPCAVINVLSKADMLTALKVFRNGGFRHLHVSCHGNSKGIGLTDGDFIPWDELASMISQNCELVTSLSLSACESGCPQAAKSFEKFDVRPWVISGVKSKPSWGDSIVGWAVLFRKLQKGNSPKIWLNGTIAAENASDIDLVSWFDTAGKGYRCLDKPTAERLLAQNGGSDEQTSCNMTCESNVMVPGMTGLSD